MILKLLNGSNVVSYKPLSLNQKNKLGNEGKMEVHKISDTCNFGKLYNSQLKRDEFFLNYRDQLLIAMKTATFLYDSKKNLMTRLQDLSEDHKGGSFVFVPYSNSVYCISGIMSILTEKLRLNKQNEFEEDAPWKFVCKLSTPRGYYCSFVQNDSKIYIMLGFDLWNNDFLTTVDKLDVTKQKEEWMSIKIKCEKLPKLTFAACVPSSDDEVFLIGGRDDFNNDNSYIYLFDLKKESFEDSNMRLPLPTFQNNETDDTPEARNLFYQENCFIALRPENNDFESCFPCGLYDSKNYLHLVNIKNFDYSYVSQELVVEEEIEEEDDLLDGDDIGDEEMHTETDKIKKISIFK